MACPVQRLRGALGRLLKRGLRVAAALRFTAKVLTSLGRWTGQDHAFIVVLIVAVPLPVLWVNMAAGVRMNGATSL